MRMIWDNDVCKEYDYIIKENSSDKEFDEETAWNEARESIDVQREDMLTSLNVNTKGALIATDKIVRWDSTHSAYKELDTKNIGEAVERVMSSFGGDNTFNVFEEDGKLVVTQLGHDNPVTPSVIEIRELTCDLDDLEDDKPETLLSNSKPCGHYAAKVYGWEVVA